MISLKGISKKYGNENVLENISLQVEEGITLSVLGKSGCGKTTLLKTMSGLVMPDSGTFTVGSKNILLLPIQKRKIVYLSQEPLLFPHLNVYDNIAYGLKIRKVPKNEIDDKVLELSHQLELTQLLAKSVHYLSGGQKQRVNFARSLIIEPELFLLDEPFNSLDSDMRAYMQQFFRKNIKGKSAFFVTHDLKEALIVGDKIAKLKDKQLFFFESKTSFIHEEENVKKELRFWQSMLEQEK